MCSERRNRERTRRRRGRDISVSDRVFSSNCDKNIHTRMDLALEIHLMVTFSPAENGEEFKQSFCALKEIQYGDRNRYLVPFRASHRDA